jgi:uncharacterized protein (DUF2225 family)
MTTLFRIELTCPVCVRTFGSQAVLTAGRSARRRTDFHEQTAGVQPLPYLVHTCPTCGYTGSHRDFGRAADVDPTIATYVWRELAPNLPSGPITGSEKYELAAKLAASRGAGPDQIGELLLRAAWCCVDEEDVEAERFFRREAAWMFEAALASWDAVASEMRALLTYLVGELWRRVGDVKIAALWFNRVRPEIVALPRQRWIIEAADRQRDDPREWFDGDKAGDRWSGSLGCSIHRQVVVERRPPDAAGFVRVLRRAAALARRAATAVSGRLRSHVIPAAVRLGPGFGAPQSQRES